MKRRGFTTLEYSLLIIILVTALLGMRVFLQRAVMGKFKSSIDSYGYGRQY